MFEIRYSQCPFIRPSPQKNIFPVYFLAWFHLWHYNSLISTHSITFVFVFSLIIFFLNFLEFTCTGSPRTSYPPHVFFSDRLPQGGIFCLGKFIFTHIWQKYHYFQMKPYPTLKTPYSWSCHTILFTPKMTSEPRKNENLSW